MPKLRPSIAFFAFAVALASVAPDTAVATDVDVNYSDGEIDTNSYSANAPDSIRLTIASGTATQSGALSGSGGVIKLGLGTLELSGTSNFGGAFSPNEGTTTITGQVTSGATSGIATAGTTASLIVTGSGANWTSNADTLIGLNGSVGNLTISNGATASDTFALVGRLAGNTGNVTITGPGSRWTHTNGIVIGTGGNGTMLVSAGGYVSNTDSTIGSEAGASGSVRVTGTGSLWASDYLVLGSAGSGTLTVDSGGAVQTTGVITLGNSGSGAGILNIGGAIGQGSSAAGTIQAATINGGSGSGTKLVNFNHTGTAYNFDTALTGNLSLQQNAGVTILSGSNTYNGGTTISGGLLRIANAAALGTGSVAVNSGTLDLAARSFLVNGLSGSSGAVITSGSVGAFTFSTSQSTATSYGGILQNGSGTMAFTKLGAGTLTLTGANTYTGTTTIAEGTLEIGGGSTTGSLASTRIVNNGNLVFNRSNSITYSGVISGTGSLTQNGPNLLTLSGSNTYTGTTYVNQGGLQIGSGANGSIAGDIVNNALLAFGRSGVFTYAGNISGTGSYTQVGSGTTIFTGSNSYTGDTTLQFATLSLGSANALGTAGTITFAGGTLQFSANNTTDYSSRFSTGSQVIRIDPNRQNVTFASSIVGAATSLVLNGVGELNLTGSNSFGGSTVVTSGTLGVSNQSALGKSSLTIDNLGRVVLYKSVTVLGLTGSISARVFGASSDGVATLTVDQNTSTTFAGQLMDGTSPLALIKKGSGTLALTASPYSGGTTLQDGVLRISNFALGTGGLDIENGVLELATSSTLVGLSGSQLALIRGGSAAAQTFTVTQSTSTTYAGSIQDGIATLSFTKIGTGSLTLSGSNSYTGKTTIGGGTLGLGGDYVLGSGTLVITGGGIRAEGAPRTVTNALALNGSFTLGRMTNFSGSAMLGANITITSANPDSAEANTSTFSGVISGTNGITFAAGANPIGKIVLSGSNTYTGDTIVSGGQVVVNGSLAGRAIVQNSGLLGGSGALGGDVIVQSGGTLSPGNSPGLLTVAGDLTLESGATLIMEFSGTGAGLYDQLDVQGIFTAGGTLNLMLISGFTPVQGASFTLFNGSVPGYESGSFSLTTNLSGGLYWNTSALASTGVVSVVPEPSTWALVALSASALLWLRPRPRRIGL